MSFSTIVSKKLWEYLSNDGYSRSGRIIYKIKNDLCFCILIEMPTGIVDVEFFILPLYIPTEYIYLSYGNRLGYAERSAPTLRKTASEEEISAWSSETYQCLKTCILPFFDKIDSPKKLARFVGRPRIIPHKYMSCSRAHRNYLALCTNAYLGRQISSFLSLIRYGLAVLCDPIEEEIPFKKGRFCAPAIPEEEFKNSVLKVKNKKT